MNGVAVIAVVRPAFTLAICDTARMDDISDMFATMGARKIKGRIVPDMPA